MRPRVCGVITDKMEKCLKYKSGGHWKVHPIRFAENEVNTAFNGIFSRAFGESEDSSIFM
jgi:hypothetical protein